MRGFAGAAGQRAGTHIARLSTTSALETGLQCQADEFDAPDNITTITTRSVRTGH